MSKARVLIVDDSPTMRMIISQVLSADPQIEIVGTAADAFEARDLIKRLNPDVITLDIEMPGLSGIEFLRRLMKLRPMPVVVVSTLTAAGSEVAIEALETGAFDCVVKPSSDFADSLATLPEKVKAAAVWTPKAADSLSQGPRKSADQTYRQNGTIVAVGSSTGGVEALQEVLTRLPANCPPILVTQHMPPTFTATLAGRLNRICAPEIQEAKHGQPCQPGNVYIAPGGEAHLELGGQGPFYCKLVRGETVNGHRPSVDQLFNSVARHAGARSMAILLTGMGYDGARGMLEMKRAGAATAAQDEATCVVYGMPKAAVALGAVDVQLPVNKIGEHILKCTNLEKLGVA